MLIVKIMSGEDTADSDTRKSHTLLAGVLAAVFERKPDGTPWMTLRFPPVPGDEGENAESWEPKGNVYVMNEAGKTISSFGVAPIVYAAGERPAVPDRPERQPYSLEDRKAALLAAGYTIETDNNGTHHWWRKEEGSSIAVGASENTVERAVREAEEHLAGRSPLSRLKTGPGRPPTLAERVEALRLQGYTFQKETHGWWWTWGNTAGTETKYGVGRYYDQVGAVEDAEKDLRFRDPVLPPSSAGTGRSYREREAVLVEQGYTIEGRVQDGEYSWSHRDEKDRKHSGFETRGAAVLAAEADANRRFRTSTSPSTQV